MSTNSGPAFASSSVSVSISCCSRDVTAATAQKGSRRGPGKRFRQHRGNSTQNRAKKWPAPPPPPPPPGDFGEKIELGEDDTIPFDLFLGNPPFKDDKDFEDFDPEKYSEEELEYGETMAKEILESAGYIVADNSNELHDDEEYDENEDFDEETVYESDVRDDKSNSDAIDVHHRDDNGAISGDDPKKGDDELDQIDDQSLRDERLNQKFRVRDLQLLHFERKGYVVLKNVLTMDDSRELASAAKHAFDAQFIAQYRAKIQECDPTLDLDSTYSLERAKRLLSQPGPSSPPSIGSILEQGPLEVYNTHRANETVASFLSSRRIASIAAQLLEAYRLCLYHDYVFLRSSGNPQSRRRAELSFTPIDTNHFVTLCIPLQPVGAKGRPLSLRFMPGSHKDLALLRRPKGNEQGRVGSAARLPEEGTGGLSLGDVIAYHGWTQHFFERFPQDAPQQMALCVSYFADALMVGGKEVKRNCTVALPRSSVLQLPDRQQISHEPWIVSVRGGRRVRHELIPVVYEGVSGLRHKHVE